MDITPASIRAAASSSANTFAVGSAHQETLQQHFWRVIQVYTNAVEPTDFRTREKKLELPIVGLVDSDKLQEWTERLQKAGYIVSQSGRLFTVTFA